MRPAEKTKKAGVLERWKDARFSGEKGRFWGKKAAFCPEFSNMCVDSIVLNKLKTCGNLEISMVW
jgi:hypothetical protein